MIDLDILIVGGGIAGASVGAEVAARASHVDHRGGGALRLSLHRSLGGILPRKLRRSDRRQALLRVRRTSCTIRRRNLVNMLPSRSRRCTFVRRRLARTSGRRPRATREPGRARTNAAWDKAKLDQGAVRAWLRRHRRRGPARGLSEAVSKARRHDQDRHAAGECPSRRDAWKSTLADGSKLDAGFS